MIFLLRSGKYGPSGYSSWKWVGPGYGGLTYLSSVTQDVKGPIDKLHLRVVFDWSYSKRKYVQIGTASDIIHTSVSATAAKPQPKFNAGFNPKEGLTFACLSQLAYKSYSEIRNSLPSYNLNALYEILDTGTDTHGFIASNSTTVVVVFRGTASFTNGITDASFIRKKVVDDPPYYCHGGFVDAFNTVYSDIKTCLDPLISGVNPKKLFISGHSLGGALASLLTYRISLEYGRSRPIMYVYGCPPVGGKDFSDHFDGMASYVITNQGDQLVH